MVTPLSPLLHALRLLQTESAGRKQGLLRPGTPGASDLSASRKPPPAALTPTALLALPARLRALRTREGTLPAAKALRLFVEAALLEELGEAMQLDPAFSDLVERTCLTLEQDAGTSRLMSRVMVELESLAG